jgi:hypothetical protein
MLKVICDGFQNSSYTSDLLNDIQKDASNKNDLKTFNRESSNGEKNSR